MGRSKTLSENVFGLGSFGAAVLSPNIRNGERGDGKCCGGEGCRFFVELPDDEKMELCPLIDCYICGN